jgi:glycosyltransferase involved in cell wall biosynthesis
MSVSIIMPVYNAEKFLPRSIESVIHQSYRPIELILVNDGSTDSSEAICRKYALEDHRIKVLSQKNKGPAAARNTGVRQASGDFVFFLDADDFLPEKALEILIAKHLEYQPDIVLGNFSKLVNDQELIRQTVSFQIDEGPFDKPLKELSPQDILAYARHFLKHPSNHLISYCWARLYKLSVIRNHGIVADEDMRLFEDLVFNLEYLKHAQKMIFVNEPVYTYTMHNHHVSASMAIIHADRLLHDMDVFRARMSKFFQRPDVGAPEGMDIQKEIGHALMHYLIIFLVRSCRLVSRQNRRNLYAEIEKILGARILAECLRHYSPSKGNSRVLPWLMKRKWIDPLIEVCRHKAYKRYGRPGVASA